MPRRCMQQKPSPLPFPLLNTPPSSPRVQTPVSLSSSTSTVAGPQNLPDSPASYTPPRSPSAISLLSGIPLVETRLIRTEIAPQISYTPPPSRNPLVSPPTPPRPSLKKRRKAPPAPTPGPASTPAPLLLPLLPLMTPPTTSTTTPSGCTLTTASSTASSGVASAAAAAAAAGLPSTATQLPMHTLPPPQTSTSSFSTSSFSTSSTSCPESGSISGSNYAGSQQHHTMVSAVISTVINGGTSNSNNNNSSNNSSNTSSSNNAAGFASCTSTPPLTHQPPISSSSSTVPTTGVSLSVSASKVLPAAAAIIGFPQMLGQESNKSKLISSANNSTATAMGSKLFQRRPAVTRSIMNTSRRFSSRDNTDEREKVARSIFGDVPLSDVERCYLAAAVEGNMSQIQHCIQAGVNVNCRDYLGRTALQLSLQGDHYEETKFLMDHCNLDVIEEGLLHAIKLENVRMCDMILNHPVYSDERNRIRLEFQHGFYDQIGKMHRGITIGQDENNSNFSPDITPIVLAAQCNNFDIVHMLLRKGFCIDTPHHYFCLCTECINHKKFDRFVHSRSRLNAYRGLASTAYMALSSDDPVLTAFELSEQLKSLEEKEKEHKSEYKALCDHCKNYAVELLELCRTNEEVMAALHGGADIHDLSRVRMAIKYEQKRFIAHASCQEHLMSIWYADVPWFQHQSFIVKLFIVPLGILFIPVTAIIYVFLPYSKIGEILRSPFMKFMNYMCSYMAFLVFLLIATTSKNTTSNSEPWVVRGFIIFYVFGMFWAECKQLWDEGVKEYFAQMWNYMDITMLALYTASYTIESIVSIKSNSYDDTSSSEFSENLLPNPRVLALVLFSVANVLSFARIAYILPASETFGQLQISYGRMLQDVFKFICIYFTVMIAFICGLTSLYSYSGESNFKEINYPALRPNNRMLIPRFDLELSQPSGHVNGLLTTFETLFWAAFGMGNPKAPKQTEKGNHLVETVGNLMYGVYIIGAVVVLINMLIAMMSNTFEEIQDDEDVEWKFARAKLWISFIDGSGTLPIPFNIIPTPKSIFKIFVYFKKIFMRYLLHSGDEPTSPSTIIDYEYKTILHRVVLRYIHKMKYDKKGDVVRDEIFDAKEEIISNVLNVHNKLNNRMDAIESNLMGIEAKIPRSNIYAANQRADYCSTDTISHDNRSLHGNQSLNPSPTLKERLSHQDSRRNLLSASPQSFTTEAQCHSTEGQDWYDRSSRFGSSKSEGRPSRPRKQMDSVTEYEMSRSAPLHNKYFSHEV